MSELQETNLEDFTLSSTTERKELQNVFDFSEEFAKIAEPVDLDTIQEEYEYRDALHRKIETALLNLYVEAVKNRETFNDRIYIARIINKETELTYINTIFLNGNVIELVDAIGHIEYTFVTPDKELAKADLYLSDMMIFHQISNYIIDRQTIRDNFQWLMTDWNS